MARREVVEDPSIPHHRNPIPPAVKIGGYVFSSAISGEDPASGTLPPEVERQVAQAFQNLRRVLEVAGGATDDVAAVTVLLKDMEHRELVNREWLKMFPDEHNRPVRHSVRSELAGGMLVQLQIIAVL